MSKYHTIIAVDTTGSQELGISEFIQEANESNIVYLYVQGDVDIPNISHDDLPTCEHMAMDSYKDCECRFGEALIDRVKKYYEDLGLDVGVIMIGAFISPL